MTRTIHCGSCGGSGYRAGTYGDIECFDCSGEGSWEAEEPTPARPRKYTPGPEYRAWCAEIDAKREPLTTCTPDPLKHLEPLLKKRRVG
jgi:hypothetical protein